MERMNHPREIIGIAHSRPTLEGAGVHLRRAFGFHDTALFDPFLLLDDFRGDRPEQFVAGFPWHPHRGIETITYMFEGSVEHGDSLGNRGTIRAGDVQWMTAGRGIIHQEMPKPDACGRMGGFQLWANLPADRKMIAPRYQEFGREALPRANLDGGAHAIVVCGRLGGVEGPVNAVAAAPGFFDIAAPAGRRIALPTPAEHNALAYVFVGRARFEEPCDPRRWEVRDDGYTARITEPWLGDHTLIRFGPGDEIRVETGDAPVRFLLMTGRPLREPIAWGGPIVMNTREELETAFRQLDDGTFLDTPPRGSAATRPAAP